MRVITPLEAKEQVIDFTKTKREFVERIIDEFNYAVINNIYHFLSTDNQKVVFYPAEQKYCAECNFTEAILEIKKAGWNVEYKIRTCAAGWFNAITITL